ncbi:ead/Ea22-like family protein [Escherichia coli]|nr:ead/Ea22-like family protein [Escherichia coli]EFM0335324.1 ead/Ea22-like family protein [Escherichia coli]
MSEIDYQALREIAKQATQSEWVAFISPGTGTYAVHTPGDKRCEDVIKWTGFDGQKNAENNARYIAAFNPEVVQALLDERESQNKRIAELEKSEEQLINERDHAESALDDMYFAATGNRPEWSNWFGFSDAVDAVVDRIADLEAKQPSPVVPEGLVKAVRFYEQVKRENPPVETGAWKDAVDWVLKEACQAVNIGIKGERYGNFNKKRTSMVERITGRS